MHQFEVGEGGNGATIIVDDQPDMIPAQEGYGNVHHLALRVADDDALRDWIEKIQRLRIPKFWFCRSFLFPI